MKLIDNIQFTKILKRMGIVFINISRQTSLILLAFVIFISTTGFKVSMHFCEDNLYDIGVLSQAQSCCVDTSHYHNHCGMRQETKSPCENETIEFQKLDNFLGSSIYFDFSTIALYDLIPSITSTFTLLEEPKICEEIVFIKETPPLCLATVLSLLQSFLI